jgi:hypothetical protein
MAFNPELFYNTIIPLGIGAWAIFISFILFVLLRRRNSYKIEVFSVPLKVKWKKLSNINAKEYIIMRKGNDKKKPPVPEWKFEVSKHALIPFKRLFGSIGYKIQVFPEAQKAIEIDYSNEKLNPYKLTLTEEIAIVDAEIVKQAGKEKATEKSMLILLILMLIGLNVILSFFLLLRG